MDRRKFMTKAGIGALCAGFVSFVDVQSLFANRTTIIDAESTEAAKRLFDAVKFGETTVETWEDSWAPTQFSGSVSFEEIRGESKLQMKAIFGDEWFNGPR